MTHDEAELLVAALVAAFPFPRPPDTTVALYVSEVQRLDDAEAVRDAVQAIIRTHVRFPALAFLLDEYRDHARRQSEERARLRGLVESAELVPPPPEVRAWMARVALRSVPSGDAAGGDD